VPFNSCVRAFESGGGLDLVLAQLGVGRGGIESREQCVKFRLDAFKHGGEFHFRKLSVAFALACAAGTLGVSGVASLALVELAEMSQPNVV
jgi:hypothetical protein